MATQRIRSDPAVMLGKPVVEDTRITVESILDELGAGQTILARLVEDDEHCAFFG